MANEPLLVAEDSPSDPSANREDSLEEALELLRSLEDIPQPEDVLPPGDLAAWEPAEPTPGWLAEFDAVLQQSLFTDLCLPLQLAESPSAVDLLLNDLLHEQAPEPSEVEAPELPSETELQPPDEVVLEPAAPVAETQVEEPKEEIQSGRVSLWRGVQPAWEGRPTSEPEEASPSLPLDDPELQPTDLLALASPADTGKPYLLFALAGAEYAVALSHVREIRNLPPVTPLPRVPKWIRGVSNLSGDILAVIDLRTFLGLPPEDGNSCRTDCQSVPQECGVPRKRLLVVHGPRQELTTGLLVDGTRTICWFPEDRITALTTPVEAAVQPYLLGQAETRTGSGTEAEPQAGRILRVLDLERLLERIRSDG